MADAIQEREAARKFALAIWAINKELNVRLTWKSPPIDQAGLREAAEYREQAIRMGREVDAAVLDRVYPELGTVFISTLYRACVLNQQGLKDQNLSLLKTAGELELAWSKWYNPRTLEVGTAIADRIYSKEEAQRIRENIKRRLETGTSHFGR